MREIYKVALTTEERTELKELVSTGKSNALKIKHANILLAVDETVHGRIADAEIAKHVHCHANTVANLRARFVEEGFEAAFEGKKRETPPKSPLFDGRAERHGDESRWAKACNTKQKGVEWHFTTNDARIKLKRLYPQC